MFPIKIQPNTHVYTRHISDVCFAVPARYLIKTNLTNLEQEGSL